MTRSIGTTPRQRTAARLAAGASDRYGRAISAYPVIVIPTGHLSPRLCGVRWHHETRGGTWVRYPSAYRRRGWSNLVYVCSTLTVYVGEEWLKQHAS